MTPGNEGIPAAPDVHRTVALVARYREGDRKALDELFARYYDRMHAVVRLRIGGALRRRLDSVDLVQEAFMAALKGIDRFAPRSEGDFFHWLCAIAENRIRDQAEHFAAQKRDAARDQPLDQRRPSSDSLVGPIADLMTRTSPATRVVREEDVARLEEAIDALPQPQREAILLVRYEGLSLQEAAEAMARTPDAVRMLVARGLVALAKALGVLPS